MWKRSEGQDKTEVWPGAEAIGDVSKGAVEDSGSDFWELSGSGGMDGCVKVTVLGAEQAFGAGGADCPVGNPRQRFFSCPAC